MASRTPLARRSRRPYVDLDTALVNLGASTLFFVIPTWVAGIASFFYGLSYFA